MSLLSPSATYHAELREQLGGVGRALALQRGVRWAARGLVLGSAAVLAAIVWAWTRDSVGELPMALLVALPLGAALVVGLGSFFLRHHTPYLARRVDQAARLDERSITALELGARGADFPLALAQMRDAVESLRRVDLIETFPPRLPRNELLTTFFVLLVAGIVAVSPNPWLLRSRASNPAISIAREQAQRVERLADSVRAEDAPELDPLKELLRNGARTIEARSNDPDEALSALEDLEEQVHQLSAGDDHLAAALAAIASALAGDPNTQQLAAAINTGDLREVSRSARNLAQQTEQLSGQDRQRVGRVLRDAANRAGRASPAVAGELSEAASALQSGGEQSEGAEGVDGERQMQAGGSRAAQSASTTSDGRSAREALEELSNSAAAAAERQRAQSQLESSRNALERALGRTQSRSNSSAGRSGTSSNQRAQGSSAQTDRGQGAPRGGGDQLGDGGEQSGGSSSTPGESSGNGELGQGSGYSTGGENQNRSAVSSLDTITRPEQVPGLGAFSPDETSPNPYLGDAADGTSRASDETVAPSFSRKPTLGNDSGSIPLGLRDLVKDYFSSLDQK
ncbi:MAG: hypothetical protein M3336_03620 [Chloroflexota bacterium]|nr:hypothetical protein [Chloroflexota bacterium]